MKKFLSPALVVAVAYLLAGCSSSDLGSVDQACSYVQQSYSIDGLPIPKDPQAIELMRLASAEFRLLAASDSEFLEYAEVTGAKASGNYLNSNSLRGLCQVE
jgi:hypothetical protein